MVLLYVPRCNSSSNRTGSGNGLVSNYLVVPMAAIHSEAMPYPLCPVCFHRGSQAYVSFNDTSYYKDFATYIQQLAIHHASPSALGPKPAWFFDVVQPLAAFNLQCDRQG